MSRTLSIIAFFILLSISMCYAKTTGIEGQLSFAITGETFEFIPGAWARYVIHDSQSNSFYDMTFSVVEKSIKDGIKTAWIEIEVIPAGGLSIITKLQVEETSSGPGKILKAIIQMQGKSPMSVPKKYYQDDTDRKVGDIRNISGLKKQSDKKISLNGTPLSIYTATATDPSGKSVNAFICGSVPPLGVIYLKTDTLSMALDKWGTGAKTRVDSLVMGYDLWVAEQLLAAFGNKKSEKSAGRSVNELKQILSTVESMVQQTGGPNPNIAVVSTSPTVSNNNSDLRMNSNSWELKTPSSSYLLNDNYSKDNMNLAFKIKWSKPGVILDTVGINTAPRGSWSLNISGEGKVSLNVFDPKVNSSLRDSSGWHHLVCKTPIPMGSEGTVLIDVNSTGIKLTVNNSYVTLDLKTPLSGDPVYIGDFPGDDKWGSKYNIHPAMVGTVSIAGSVEPPIEIASVPTVVNTTNPASFASDKPDVINAGVKKIEDAFRSGNVNSVISLTAPFARTRYQDIFESRKGELKSIADMMATRKLVSSYGAVAEYEVVHKGRNLTMIFEKIDDKWCLSSF